MALGLQRRGQVLGCLQPGRGESRPADGRVRAVHAPAYDAVVLLAEPGRRAREAHQRPSLGPGVVGVGQGDDVAAAGAVTDRPQGVPGALAEQLAVGAGEGEEAVGDGGGVGGEAQHLAGEAAAVAAGVEERLADETVEQLVGLGAVDGRRHGLGLGGDLSADAAAGLAHGEVVGLARLQDAGAQRTVLEGPGHPGEGVGGQVGEQVEEVGAALGRRGHETADGVLLDEGEVGGADVPACELGGGDLDGAAGQLTAGCVEQAADQLAGGGVLELLEDGEHREDDLDVGVGQPGTEGQEHVALRHRVGDQRAERLEAAQLVDAGGARELVDEPLADQ